MIKNELKTELAGIRDEQKKLRKAVEDINSDLVEYDKDHLLLMELKTQVAGLRDSIDSMSRRLDKFHQKTADTVEEAVERGIQPATDAAEAIADGLQSGAIPVDSKTAKSIKASNWVNKFVKKWSKKRGDK